MKKLISMICLAAACMVAGCAKDKDADPCAELLTQASPDKVLLKFVDKASGMSLIGNGGLEKESIVVTDVATGEAYKNWGIVQHQMLGEGNGGVQLVLFPAKAGHPAYRIVLGSKGVAVLDFKVTKHQSNSPCGGEYFSISDYKTDQEFSYFELNNLVYKNMLVVKI